MATAAKAKSEGVLEGTIVYAKIAQADKKYQSADTEYSIALIVDEDVADAWNEVHAKQQAKKIKVADFETKYRFACPIENVKNVYEIKLKRDAVVDGEPFYPEHRPRVFLDTNDGERIDITESRLIANGSFGKVSYRINTNDFGCFAKLKNVLVQEDDFKEYISNGGGASGGEFGAKEVKKEAARAEVTQGRVSKKAVEEPAEDAEPVAEKVAKKPAAKKAAAVADEDGTGSPF